MSERGMDELSKRGLLGGRRIEKLDFCEHYVYGCWRAASTCCLSGCFMTSSGYCYGCLMTLVLLLVL